jgi:hypothetical protein
MAPDEEIALFRVSIVPDHLRLQAGEYSSLFHHSRPYRMIIRPPAF